MSQLVREPGQQGKGDPETEPQGAGQQGPSDRGDRGAGEAYWGTDFPGRLKGRQERSGESSFLPLFLTRKATAMSSLLNALLALLGAAGLGFLYRYHNRALSKATAKADALAEVVRQNRTRAIQKHTENMGVLDATEQELERADIHELADTLDAVFGAGVSVPEDDADGGGSDGPM